MSYLDTNARTTKPTSSDKFNPLGRFPAHFGVFIGFIKDAADVQKNGRLRVWIPEFGSAPHEEQGWTTVSYCSPFAGATNVATISKTDLENFDKTQTSYGMWMIPPDINNQVLVMFAGGDPARGFWIGCVFDQFMNNMIPGMAADPKSWQYPGKQVPVAEYNKWDKRVVQPDRASKPYEKTKFKGVGNQGLITDQGRGVTTSSARRESPSNVFGILTPGPVIDTTVSPDNIRRKGGSSFIMDDGTGSEYVQLTTKSGAQIKLDETNGFVYLINRDGTAWVQMDQKGNIDIFGATSISMRAQTDINLRADRNINIEAGQNIFMKAAKDTRQDTTSFTYDVNNVPKPLTIPYYKFVGEGAGEGGNIVIQSLNNVHQTVQKNMYLTVKENDLSIKVNKDFTLTTVIGKQDYKSALNVNIQTDQNYNLVAALAIKTSAGTSINHTAGTTFLNKAVAEFGIEAITTRISGSIDIGGAAKMGGSLGVVGGINGGSLSLSGGIVAGTIVGNFPGLRSGPGATTGGPGSNGPTPASPSSPAAPAAPVAATPAEVKQLVEKINILATWADPESKFKRNAEALKTTVSVLPTYEPAPEHEAFTFASITGYSPIQTEGAKTYEGSSGGGATTSPLPNTDPGANNTELPPTPASESAVTKDFNMSAYQCQLKIHEGVKYVSYLDSVGLPTGGIGHLLRTNEILQFPVPTPISEAQVNAWFQVDAQISISGAQRVLGINTWAELSDIRKRACADLCYNLGEPRLSKFVRFIAAMRAGNYNLAGQSLRESKWFTQVGLRGPKIIAMIVQNIDPNGCDKKFPAA